MIQFSMNNKNKPHKKRTNGVRLEGVLPFVLLIVLLIFVFYPILMIFIQSFTSEGTLSLHSYKEALSSNTTRLALGNTLILGVGTILGTWILGGTLAIIRHRTNYRYKKQMDMFVFLSFTIPAYILSITWIEIMSRGGYLHRIVKYFDIGSGYRFDAYTISVAILVLTLHLYPLVYYGVGNALKVLGVFFEESAKTCGIGKMRIIFRITIPLVIPAFLSTGLLVVSRSMANYGVLAQLALPSGKEVLSTRIFSAMADLDLSSVSVLSVLLIVISSLLYVLSEILTKKKTVSVKTSSRKNESLGIVLGKFQKPLHVLITLFFILSIVIPMMTIFVSSFFKRWGLAFKWENLTLSNYVKLFSQENLLTRPLINTLIFGLIAAILATIIATLTVYFYQYKKSPLSKIIMSIAQLPIAVPNMILGIAAMFAWIREPFKLYGTAAILVVTYTVLFIPICIKQIVGTAENMDISMDAAAKTMSIPMRTRFYRLFLPQIKDSVISGFILCFLVSMKEIPISLLLYTATSKTLGVLMFTVQSNSYGLEMTSAISVVVIVISVVGNILIRKLGSKGYKI